MTTVLLALSLTFGLVMAANAVTPAEQKVADEYRAKAAEKVARLNNSQHHPGAARGCRRTGQADEGLGGHRLERYAEGVRASRREVGRCRRCGPPGPGGVPDYFGSTANWAYSPLLRKFVDTLPGPGR